jgi:hypothetical protein
MIVGSEAAGNASSSIRNPLSPSRLVCLADPAFRGGERVPDALFKMFWWHRGHQLRVKNPLALFIYSQFERKRMLEPVSSRAKKIDEPELVTVIMEDIIAQTDSIDIAFAKFERLLEEARQFGDTLFTEADTRVKIIDTMLIDVLGWQKADVFTEESAGKGYLDYKLAIEGLSKVIVEAKRDGRDFELATRECGGAFKLSGPVFKNSDVQEGISQAIHYSSYKGTELACVTNGREWVVFRSNRIGDGVDTMEGKAFVFPSLECIRNQFRLFFDLLAKHRIRNLVFRGLLQEAEGRIFGKGIRVDFSDLIKFVLALQEVFLNSDKTSYWIGCLANHDIRRVLEVSRDLINSPHLGFDEAFKAYVVGSAIHIRPYKIRKALIPGRYDIYTPESHKYLHNVFDLNGEIQTSPVLGLRILQALKDADIRHGETRSKYISKVDLVGYLCGMGLERRAISLWLDALLKRALVLNYDPTCIDESSATRLEISPTGELHLFWGCGDYDYLFAMAETTPIRKEGAFIEMQRAYHEHWGKHYRSVVLADFLRYLIMEDQIFAQVPDHESYNGQHGLVRRLGAAARKFER